MTQQQTKHHSGSKYHLNLDSISYAALSACRQIHRDNGNPCSNSVIVRRALRHYYGSLERLTGGKMEQEVVETLRAAKGVL
jgi:hypothetical protein